jgi:hypothetical protein
VQWHIRSGGPLLLNERLAPEGHPGAEGGRDLRRRVRLAFHSLGNVSGGRVHELLDRLEACSKEGLHGRSLWEGMAEAEVGEGLAEG